MNIAQLVSHHHWKHKLCRARFLAVEPLKVKRTGLGWNGYDATETVTENLVRIYGELPDVVIAYKPLDHREFAELKCVKLIQYNEIKPPKFIPEVKQSKPDIVVFHHFNDWQKWSEPLSKDGIKTVHIPHMADPAIFKPYDIPKVVDVMVVGAIGPKVYPLRSKFIEACKLLNSRGYECVTWPHPGDVLEDASTCQHLRDFAMAISQAKIVCTCSSIYQYRLGKYAEVPACGTLLAADKPAAEDGDTMGGLDGHMVEFASNESVVNITEGLEQFLRSKVREDMVAKGIEYAKLHTPQTYSDRLMAAIEGAI